MVRVQVAVVRPQSKTPALEIRSLQIFWMAAAAGLIVSSPSLAHGQQDRVGTASISGVVLDHETNDPLIGVEMSVDGTSALSITNEQGEFYFEEVLAGSVSYTHLRAHET